MFLREDCARDHDGQSTHPEHHLACDDATVVVGTVIDPDMGGSMRVTVVATGLGRAAAVQKQHLVEEAQNLGARTMEGGNDDLLLGK